MPELTDDPRLERVTRAICGAGEGADWTCDAPHCMCNWERLQLFARVALAAMDEMARGEVLDAVERVRASKWPKGGHAQIIWALNAVRSELGPPR